MAWCRRAAGMRAWRGGSDLLLLALLPGWLGWLGSLLHLGGTPLCAAVPVQAPTLSTLVQRAELTSGGYAVALQQSCQAGTWRVRVDTVAPQRLAKVVLARTDGTVLDLRWQDGWQRWLHGRQMRAGGRERPAIDLVQAMQRVMSHGTVTQARLQYRDGQPQWSLVVERDGHRHDWQVQAVDGQVQLAGHP